MDTEFFIVFGALAAIMLFQWALDARKEKHPWRHFAGGAACSLALVSAFAWLTHWVWSWMLETGLIVAFVIIAFGFLCFYLLIGALGAVADAIKRD